MLSVECRVLNEAAFQPFNIQQSTFDGRVCGSSRAPPPYHIPRRRRRKIKPLPVLDAELLADAQLFLGLDGLGDGRRADGVGEAGHEVDEAAADWVLLDALKQRVADLQVVGLQLGDRLERGVAGAA